MMMFPDAYKVLFETYMLAKEAEYWRENTRQRLEVVGTEITWEGEGMVPQSKAGKTFELKEHLERYLHLSSGSELSI
ncbi:hypothetical protein MTR_8g031690 [Medicago truncatula]|uniref:Uncharacterized protein n=1 Tax=Medicago truncatula TaxID=3880 RepID=A0A072TN73_MEDTR|nr:hypothetical protein MTR_8g031690 [Medicago truncatula]